MFPRRRRARIETYRNPTSQKRPSKNFLLTRLAARSLLETLSLTHYILDRVREVQTQHKARP